mgnify:CR=1 FL=1
MKKLGVRERIIGTASELFYNQGYNQTGINQIIDQAGVAKASMYQHFNCKTYHVDGKIRGVCFEAKDLQS